MRILFLFLMTSWVWAHGPMKADKIKGKVYLEIDGKRRELKEGEKVPWNQKVIVDKSSQMIIDYHMAKVLMSEDTVCIFKASKEEGKEKKTEYQLLKGKVRYLVKPVSKEWINNFRIKTPTAVAGVRGTDFWLYYDERDQFNEIIVFDSKVEFGLKDGESKVIQKGQWGGVGGKYGKTPNVINLEQEALQQALKQFSFSP